ncbi:probable serine protease EDA2 [Selaginella moellendorffii]|uniref:probable serine protease EDA2 n=1 Tax=Selaginella moellendorffii TaxID=88036 RepID=UPI000D1C302C|nr:probable serine protease EDA2 [Selaginella moellendorffii]|eukprot:XP_024524829.1 probable serine protease EDA2 [Selaginella moellendorffii]
MLKETLMLSLVLVFFVAATPSLAFSPGLRASSSSAWNVPLEERRAYFQQQKLDHFTPEDVAKEFGAAVVTLEHRFYGESSPFHNLTVDNLKYLTIQQSLLDHAEFIAFYQVKLLLSRSQLSQMGITAGPECKRVLQNVTSIVEKALLENGTAIKSFFDPNAVKAQSGRFNQLCTSVLNASATNNATKLLVTKFVFHVQSPNCFKQDVFSSFPTGPVDFFDVELLRLSVQANQSSARDQWAWKYQVCTEMGLFRVSSGPDGLYYLDQCSQMFGQGIQPDVATTNLLFGGAKIAEPSFMLDCHSCSHVQDFKTGCVITSKLLFVFSPNSITFLPDPQECDMLDKARAFIRLQIGNWLQEYMSQP